MTSPLPVKVPTREQCDAALGYLRTSYESVLSMMAKEWRGEEFHRRELACNFPKAAAALGLRLSADEEAAQHPSDLVKRLRSISLKPPMTVVQSWITEAAARIEALEAAAPDRELELLRKNIAKPALELEAAAAQPSEREKALVRALTDVLAEIKKYHQTFDAHIYVAAERALTTATPDAGREEAK